jgi:hypothetical protein
MCNPDGGAMPLVGVLFVVTGGGLLVVTGTLVLLAYTNVSG